MSFGTLLDQLTGDAQDPRIVGLVTGEVTSLTADGPMVKVYTKLITEPVGPARMAAFMAGGQRGAFFMPEVGDEVVVGFELGNPNRPIILGALWSDVDAPPSTADTSSSNNIRSIVSRALHQLTFDDSNGALKLTLKSGQNGYEITIQDQPNPRITIKTTGVVATSNIELDGVAWNHQHATGVGLSGPPLSIREVP